VGRLNEARIVILGDKGAGKTSLARKLQNINAQLPEANQSTEGVDIIRWELPEIDGNDGGNVHIWDFAGHVITHAAHRFFLSERCIYIIVYDGRINDRNIDDSMEYWLDHAKNYGGNSPVYIVGNKKDNHTPEIDENNLKDKYPNTIKDVKYLSIKDDSVALETFRAELADFIRQSSAWNKEIPKLWFVMKEKLQEKFVAKKDYITTDEFYVLARNLNIKEKDFAPMRGPLHELGICLWYRKIPQLNMFVLNPNWISYGVYKIINWLKEEKKHDLWLADFQRIFSKKEDVERYPSEKYHFLFTIMSAYELAYPIENSNNKGLIIPILLPQKQPAQGMDRDFPVTDSLLMRYKTENTLPPDTISRFIVRHHQDIQTSKDKLPIVWRRGVKLGDKNRNQALVVEDNREIRLYAKGETAKKYFKDLRSTLDDIFESYQSNNPAKEYKITETVEKKPVYADDGTIRAYDIDGRLYLDATTGKEINMTNIKIRYDVADKDTNIITSVIVNSKDVVAPSTIKVVNNPPPEITLENFRVLLDELSKFSHGSHAECVSNDEERRIFQKKLDIARSERNPEAGWKMLVDAISVGGGVASIASLFALNPPAVAGVVGFTALFGAFKKVVEKIKRR